MREDLLAHESVQESARAYDRASFGYMGERAVQDALVSGHERNRGIVDRIFSDRRLLEFVGERILDEVYERLNSPA